MEVKPGYKQTEVGVIPEDWQSLSLGTLASVAAGGTPSRKVPAFWNGNIPWVTTTQIDSKVIARAEEYISELGLANSSAKLLEAGTLLIALYGQGKTRGKVGILGITAATNQACAAIIPSSQISRSYIFHFLASKYDSIRGLSNSGGQENLSGQIVKNLQIALPPTTAEQEAIAEALSDADAYIESLEQLIAKKRQIKQGAMQELLYPKDRWARKQLADVASINKGVQPSRSDIDSSGDFPYLNGGMTPSGYVETFNTPAHTIVISEGGNSCGYVQLMRERFWCGGHCYAVVPTGVSNLFLYYQLKYVQALIMGLRVGSGLPNVQKSALCAVEVYVPASIAEQEAIAAVLSDMDTEITALEAKLAKARQVKQGMMQELLTGNIRLV